MSAPTTSVAPAVLDALLTLVNATFEEPVKAFETWPGFKSGAQMLVLGEVEWSNYEIATVKAGRKQRQENFDIGWEIYVLGQAGTTPANAGPARSRAFELLEVIEDLAANDVTAGLTGIRVQHIQLRPGEASARKFNEGWGYRIAGSWAIDARLL